MSTFGQTVLPATVTALMAGRVAVTRTGPAPRGEREAVREDQAPQLVGVACLGCGRLGTQNGASRIAPEPGRSSASYR